MSDVPHIFDRKARTLRRARAAKARAQSFLVLEAAAGVAERAGAANRTFRNALELGSTDAAFGLLKPLAENWTRAEFPENEILDVPPQSFDLAVSALALHAINDLPGALIQVRRALKPDGLFVAALFGGDTLKELRESLASGEDEASGGVSPRPNLTWYNASKGWMITATRAMAVELAPFQIRVNAINPVAGETPLLATFMGEDTPEIRAKFLASIPLGRFSTPADMGAAAAFLCSDDASMVTGVAMEVDGGRCI